MPREWSLYQRAIFDAVADRSPDAPHLAVRARAGSGKTTTGVEALRRTPTTARVLACAFNADIARTLEARAPWWVETKTFHSLGLAALRQAWGTIDVDKQRLQKLMRAQVPGRLQYEPGFAASLMRVISLAKSTLTPAEPGALTRLGLRHYIDGMPEPWTPLGEQWATLAATTLTACKTIGDVVDFDDMCWLPIVHDIPMQRWDVVMVDEAQDLNACQHELVRRLVGGSGRVLLVGDDRQAIYQFRAAHENSFDALADHFNAEMLPLSISYRCDAAIIREARQIVPDIEAAPDVAEGIVREADAGEMLQEAGPGDFILSRSRAPLVDLYMRLVDAGIPVMLVGQDIASSVRTLVKRSKAKDIKALDAWLVRYIERLKERADEDVADALDMVKCARTLATGARSIDQLYARLDMLADDADGNPDACVRLSTVHKAKGLEADRVWMLMRTFREGITAEDNLRYVAITRARHELVKVYA